MEWETVIGLEVHVQLATASKLFCACAAAFGDAPNTHVCPTCLGLPGALPSPNAHAVRLAVRAALALDCAVPPASAFARKHYFYPDLPKGYQITQYAQPLAARGRLVVASPKRGSVPIGIERLHLEEDAAKLLHDRVPGATAVDFNRAGVPLAEIVTAPDLRSPAEARAFLDALKRLLEYLAVSDCRMETGSLRVDANLSVRRRGEPLGVKQEAKNMNSFAAVERALTALRDGQLAARARGEAVPAATFAAGDGTLQTLRSKETTPDYRYVAEPDLPLLVLDHCGIDRAAERAALPELPDTRQERLATAYGLTVREAAVLTARRALADYFEAVVRAGAEPRSAAGWVMGPVLHDAGAHDGRLRVAPARLAALLALVADGSVSRQAATRLLPAVADTADPPRVVAERAGLLQVTAPARLAEWVDAVLAAHPEEAARLRGGERRLLRFFIGEVMRLSGGRADPERVGALLRGRVE